jgi:ABC-2 type transport system ATP-binding protein
MDEADRCDELLFVRAGRVLARGNPRELRASAGTDDLEAAFLHFAGVQIANVDVPGAVEPSA